jgi:hypothetical protein
MALRTAVGLTLLLARLAYPISKTRTIAFDLALTNSVRLP